MLGCHAVTMHCSWGGLLCPELLSCTDGVQEGQVLVGRVLHFRTNYKEVGFWGRETGGGGGPCPRLLPAPCRAGAWSVHVVSGREDSDTSSREMVEGPAAEDEAPGPWGPGKPAALPPCSGEWGRPWLEVGGLASLSLLGLDLEDLLHKLRV